MPEQVTVEIVITARDEASEVLDGARASLEQVREAAAQLAEEAAATMQALEGLRDRARAEGYAAGVSYLHGMEAAIRDGVPDLQSSLRRVMSDLASQAGRELAAEIGDALARELTLQGVVSTP